MNNHEMILQDFIKVIDHLPYNFFRIHRDPDGCLWLLYNKGGLTWEFGLPTNLPHKVLLKDVLPPSYFAQADEMVKQTLRGENVEFHIEHQGRFYYHVLTSVEESNISSDVIGIVTEATESIQLEEKLRQQESFFDLFLSQSLEGCFFMMLEDPVDWQHAEDTEALLDHILVNQKLVKINQAMANQYGTTIEEMLGKTPAQLFADHLSYARKLWREMLEQGRTHMITQERRMDGSIIWVEGDYICIYDEAGRFRGHIGVQRDVTEHRMQEEKLRFLAYHDMLTGLPNMLSLEKQLTAILKRAFEHPEFRVVLAYFDIDRFKLINDSFGHFIGDELLQSVAERIEVWLEDGEWLARKGGDEFFLLFTGQQDSHYIEERIASLQTLLRQPFYLEEQECYVYISIGFASYPEHGTTANQLVQNAEAAMYRAKFQGGNMAVCYQQGMNRQSQIRLETETDLRKAMESNQFQLYYQPQVDIQSGKIIGAEALIRWIHPEKGMIQPLQFIPIAEETGLIIPVGRWVLHEACRQNKAWQEAGYPPIKIGVNLSLRQFLQHDLMEMVSQTLEETQLQPEYLDIELTESISMQDQELVITTLHQLDRLGVRISIDDFGTGYSSLSYLKLFPIDSLKIDRSFIQEIDLNTNDSIIAEAMIALGHSLKLQVVAEGVENQTQLWYLQEKGCDQVQGYYYSKPIPASQFEELLKKENEKAMQR
ncbi:putative bifunctional diguanylate cyclase/phosphodiesterase [Rubeoparvulum massiliense]|uniref:putative bifunctional diguanylate cyclase/phosphodiesterase n=1 Tax=Rubeoparvulum massiliense TaxID=1631346 RepID=UPI00065E9688|nr:EAL domain-containing protein [Rubeoparvulum massiliense]